MKTVKIIIVLSSVLTLSILALNLESCKDNEPSHLSVVRVATDLDVALDGTEVTDVPLKSSIIIKFSKAVNVSSATEDAVAIMSDDLTIIPSDREVTGDSVILKPLSQMAVGTNYTVSISNALKAMDGASAKESKYDFKTFGRTNAIPPSVANQLSYFSFSGNLNDEVGTHTPVSADVRDIIFGVDRFGFEGLAGTFNGSTSIVEVPKGDQYMLNNSLTISVWIKANSTKNGQFVLGLASRKGFQLELATDWSWVDFTTQYLQEGNFTDSQDNQFQGSGLSNANGGWQGTTFQESVPSGVGLTYFKDKWAHVVYTYDAATKLATTYINGAKVIQSDFNLWPVAGGVRTISGVKYAGNLTGGGNKLALGFIQGSQNRIITDSWANPADIYSNHFQGLMDDVRIFKVALTAEEVAVLYAAEKP